MNLGKSQFQQNSEFRLLKQVKEYSYYEIWNGYRNTYPFPPGKMVKKGLYSGFKKISKTDQGTGQAGHGLGPRGLWDPK
jgi:hypothetical protein